MPARGYVELHAKSAFSFLEGASTPEQLAAECARYGQHAIALTDVNGVYGQAAERVERGKSRTHSLFPKTSRCMRKASFVSREVTKDRSPSR